MTAQIVLIRRGVALVDDEDYARFGSLRWSLLVAGGGRTYAAHRQKGKNVLLHRAIMNPSKGFCVDHINGDGLDNRRANLRLCSYSENLGNAFLRRDRMFKGVHLKACRFSVNIAGKWIGTFPSAEEAAYAYDDAARQRWGEFARLNFPRPGERGCRREEARNDSGFLKDSPVAISRQRDHTPLTNPRTSSEHLSKTGQSEAQS